MQFKKIGLSLVFIVLMAVNTQAAAHTDIMDSIAALYMQLDGEDMYVTCFAIEGNENGAVTFLTTSDILELDISFDSLEILSVNSREHAAIVMSNRNLGYIVLMAENPIPDRIPADKDIGDRLRIKNAEVYAIGLASTSGEDPNGKGLITNPSIKTDTGVQLIETTCSIDYTNIGGQLVLGGYVIGLNTFVMPEHSYAASISDIYNDIEKQKAATETTAAETTPVPAPSNSALSSNTKSSDKYIIIGFAACLAILFIVIKVVKPNAKKV